MYTVGIVTVSDKGFRGERKDASGPKIRELLPSGLYRVVSSRIVPDEQEQIEAELIRLADECRCSLILTTGGTGFSVRDVTPEATMRVAHRNAPGIAQAIRAYSMSITKRAMLSRGASVIRGQTLIINLPGSPKAVAECMECILEPLSHGLAILLGETGECARREAEKLPEDLIIVRGGGDIATGTIHRLWSAGYPVLVLETDRPAAIRRQVSVCEAVYEGQVTIEGMTAVRISDCVQAAAVLAQGQVPVLTDPEGSCIAQLRPCVVVDAILAKKNLGTNRGMAPLTIGLGPGFTAGSDVDAVIETMRGHNLGRVIRSGQAMPNTGVPGVIGGYGAERVIYAPEDGILHAVCSIGSTVEAGEVIARIETGKGGMEDTAAFVEIRAAIPGMVRGMLRDGFPVKRGLKLADIDPRRDEKSNCFTISDKARCIAGGVLEVVCGSGRRRIQR